MYFSFDGDNFEIHNTEQEARDCAEDALDYFRVESVEGWRDESMNICWGKVSQSVRVTEERPVNEDDPCRSNGIEIYQKRELVDCATEETPA